MLVDYRSEFAKSLISKIDSFLEVNWSTRLLDFFLQDVSTHLGRPAIVGGFLRDLVWGRPWSDIDVVIDCSKKDFNKYFKTLKTDLQRDRIRVVFKIGDIKVDVWPLCEGKLFSNGVVQYKGFSSYTEIPFLSCNTILFDYKRDEIHVGNTALRDLEEETVCVNNPKGILNPTKIQSLVNRLYDDGFRIDGEVSRALFEVTAHSIIKSTV